VTVPWGFGTATAYRWERDAAGSEHGRSRGRRNVVHSPERHERDARARPRRTGRPTFRRVLYVAAPALRPDDGACVATGVAVTALTASDRRRAQAPSLSRVGAGAAAAAAADCPGTVRAPRNKRQQGGREACVLPRRAARVHPVRDASGVAAHPRRNGRARPPRVRPIRAPIACSPRTCAVLSWAERHVRRPSPRRDAHVS
jgi:hypothetical protein